VDTPLTRAMHRAPASACSIAAAVTAVIRAEQTTELLLLPTLFGQNEISVYVQVPTCAREPQWYGKYDKVPQTLLTSFDISEKYVGGVNDCEIFLWII